MEGMRRKWERLKIGKEGGSRSGGRETENEEIMGNRGRGDRRGRKERKKREKRGKRDLGKERWEEGR